MTISSTAIPAHILRLMPEAERRRFGKAGLTVPEIEAQNGDKLEKEIQEQIAQYLQLHEVRFNRSRMERKTTCLQGWPDFTFCVKGRACFFEVKRPGQKPDPEQSKVLSDLIAAGTFVRIVHSLQEAIEAYQEINGELRSVASVPKTPLSGPPKPVGNLPPALLLPVMEIDEANSGISTR